MRGEKEKGRRKREKPGQAPEIKTTMTDFRIVGIEIRELGWSWGLVDEKVELEGTEPAVKEDSVNEEKAVEVKCEPVDEIADVVEEKRGEKRKAKTPDLGWYLTL